MSRGSSALSGSPADYRRRNIVDNGTEFTSKALNEIIDSKGQNDCSTDGRIRLARLFANGGWLRRELGRSGLGPLLHESRWGHTRWSARRLGRWGCIARVSNAHLGPVRVGPGYRPFTQAGDIR